MKKTQLLLVAGLIGCAFISCEKNDINYNEFNIINNGNGAVTSITDTEDTTPLSIVQTIPSLSSMSLFSKSTASYPDRKEAMDVVLTKSSGEGTFPANLPMMFFFNDKILLGSIADNLVITVDGQEIKGTVMINEGANGYAILTFTPWQEFKVDKSISVTIKQGILDDGGNEMVKDLVLSYTTSQPGKGSFDNNKDFENNDEGVMLVGDGDILSGDDWGDLTSYSGSRFAAISSGSQLVSDEYAIGYTSSMAILGPVNKQISELSFYYDFISAEFDDYVNSEFDDCVMVTVSGPKGAYSEFLTSVNSIGYDNETVTFPGLPDGGDSKAGHIGWTKKTMDIPSVGTPAYITFTVTDVSDMILSSVLTLDKLEY